MAFKRSAVRSRLSPPKTLISSEIKVFSCFYDLQSVIFFGFYQKENADLCDWFLVKNYEIKRTDLMAEIRLR